MSSYLQKQISGKNLGCYSVQNASQEYGKGDIYLNYAGVGSQ